MNTSLPPHRAIVRKRVKTISLLTFATLITACQQPDLSDREKKRLVSLSISSLAAPVDVSNRYADHPAAQQLGEKLFFDARLSKDASVSCATCHVPELGFIDGLARAKPRFTPDGDFPALRNTPTVVGSAWHTWQYWDGRRDSLWSQALTPIESPVEMAGTRVAVARLILQDPTYLQSYESVFGPVDLAEIELPAAATPMGSAIEKRRWYQVSKPIQTKINRTFVNVGKALAAYQSTLRPPVTRFDKFAEKLASGAPYHDELSALEYRGARLFVNEKKTQCLECHNGPLLTNGDFHNIGTANFTGENIDFGRILGVQSVMIDEFNCHGRYSDAVAKECRHLNFMSQSDFVHTQGGYRTPTLRNAAKTGPYFHDGRFDSLEQVINHYVSTAETDAQTELRPFPLNENEVKALAAFIKTLNSD